jgi:hypothetical protein
MSIARMLTSAATIIMATSLISHSAIGATGELWPSEAVTLINHALRLNPEVARREITEPFIKRMRTGDLSEMESFFKGESHFLHLEPEPARDVYWEFRKRSDAIGRVAVQRLMVIRINAFGMVSDLLENDIPDYRRRFPVRASDRYGITFPVSRTALALIEQDRASEALDLIVEHVKLHDEFDSAYSAYRLPGQFLEVARQNGRADEFVELQSSVISGLDIAIGDRFSATPIDPDGPKKLPGIVFRSLFEDTDLTFNQWTAEMMDLRDDLLAAAKTVN